MRNDISLEELTQVSILKIKFTYTCKILTIINVIVLFVTTITFTKLHYVIHTAEVGTIQYIAPPIIIAEDTSTKYREHVTARESK
jgi:hypothetical protein